MTNEFNFDDFESDINTAEEIIDESNNERLRIQAADSSNGNQDAAQCQPGAKADGEKRPTHELGLFDGISNDDYHRLPGLSSSNIKPALKSMNLYNETRCGRVPFHETDPMRLGTTVHALVLEPDDFKNQVAVSKKFGTNKAAKEEKAEFYANNEGMTIINADDYDTARYMADSLTSLSEVSEIMATGKPEQSGFYIDRETNMLCKYRADWENEWCIADVKTCRDASGVKFGRTIDDLNYHVSGAHYLDGSRILTGQTHNQFIFMCVESSPPYEAAVYVLGDESLEAGMLLRRNALDSIKRCREADEWPLLNNGIAETIEIPGYALNNLRLSKI